MALVENRLMIEERCILFRGRIIHYMIDLETAIELFISQFFCHDKDRINDFWNVIATATDRVSFNSKAGILGYILKQYYPEFIAKYPDYLERINELIKTRNIVAHRKLDLSDERIANYNGDSIFIKWMGTNRGKLRKEFLELNESTVNSLIVRILHSYSETMEVLETLLNQRGRQ